MRILKLVLFVAMIYGMGWMWTNRATVVEAYTEEHEPVDLRLDGLDLTAEVSRPDPSPYLRIEAPDTRTVIPIDPAAPAALPATTLGGGSASFSGFVTEVVDGIVLPVTGAVVTIERTTSGGSASDRVVTGPDGAWAFTGVAGGNISLRSFVPGQLTSGPALVLFATAGSSHQMNFGLVPADPGIEIDLVSPAELVVGSTGTVAVTVSTRTIDAAGRIVQVPVPGQSVSISTGGVVLVLSASTVSTDTGGASRYLLSCVAPGSGSLTAGLGDRFVSFALPPCVTPPPPPVDAAPAEAGDQ